MQDTTAEPASSPLGNINQHFHQCYARRKQDFKDKISRGEVLLIIRMDSRLVASCGDDIQELPVNGETYHQCKALAHSTLAAYYTLLHSPPEQAVSLLKDWLPQLKSEAAPELASTIAAHIRQLINDVTKHSTVSHLQIQHFAKALEPVFARLLVLSAEDEVKQLHRQLNKLTSDYDIATSDSFFIVFGGPQARSRELAKLVFTKWCDESDDLLADSRHHVRYFENASTIADAAELVATLMADRELAQTFLGRAEGLEQDVLGKAAEKVLERCWPKPQAKHR
ncbi:hypothetical protein [Arsukibacterium sp.]|uniref:hypothetical protein n=1 Tax=Arsukibacterium sp. TaxID=1977258 RepID=UPI00299E87B0|nr:hypothetical protein [Arsukibacterium sp.]MDX1536843.1 hypothetical protein [Arsukibacterium sp.]